MKLLAKTNLYFIFASIILLFIGVQIFYFFILKKFDAEHTEHLLESKKIVLENLNEGIPIDILKNNIEQKIDIIEIPKQTLFQNIFRDYSTRELEEEKWEKKEENESIINRELLFQTKTKDKVYAVKISTSLTEGKEIGEYILKAMIIFMVFSTIIFLIITILISKRIWAPFYATISELKLWNLQHHKQIFFEKTEIKEFDELNKTISELIKKSNIDYENLKEFTENISHETQTPIAIASAKLELLMQQSNYTNEQQQLLKEAYSSIIKLKKLNQALTVLSRIERGNYENSQLINISEEVDKKIIEFQEFINEKNITVKKTADTIQKKVNPELLNILLNNLFNNAIKHNITKGGKINILINDKGMIMENTGAEVGIKKANIFSRFKKYKGKDDSLGLGLSIIKKAADCLSWNISYDYIDSRDVHKFMIDWDASSVH